MIRAIARAQSIIRQEPQRGGRGREESVPVQQSRIDNSDTETRQGILSTGDFCRRHFRDESVRHCFWTAFASCSIRAVVATQFRTVWQSDTFVFRTSVDQCDCGERYRAGETLPFDTNGDSKFDDTSKRQPRAVATIASLSNITSFFLFLPNIILQNKRGQPFRPAPLRILIRLAKMT